MFTCVARSPATERSISCNRRSRWCAPDPVRKDVVGGSGGGGGGEAESSIGSILSVSVVVVVFVVEEIVVVVVVVVAVVSGEGVGRGVTRNAVRARWVMTMYWSRT